MKKASFILFILLSLLTLSGCKKEQTTSPEPNPSLTGRWFGASGGLMISLTLTESNQSVSGSGSISSGTQSLAITISGTHVYPNVSLNISATGYQPMNFTGRFSDKNTIPGKFNGSGFVDFDITLIRQ